MDGQKDNPELGLQKLTGETSDVFHNRSHVVV
jgi:hypothetical protein